MPAPTNGTPYNLDIDKGTEIRIGRRVKVNPYTAGATDSPAAPVADLPPAPPVGLVYPR